MYIRVVVLGVALACSTVAASQSGYVVEINSQAAANTETAPAPTPVAKPKSRTLPASSPVKMHALEEISSKTTEIGTKVRFSVAEDVVEGGAVAIPRGAPATGTVSWKTGRAIGGKSGKFEITFNHVIVDGRQVQLMGKHREEGKGNTAGALFGSMVVTGRSGVMLPGESVLALTAEPFSF